MPKLNRSELAASKFFANLGMSVRRVTDDGSADFEINGDAPPYLVEVTARHLDARLANIEPGGTASKGLDAQFDVGTLRDLQKVRRQCASIDPRKERLWFAWISPEDGINAGAQIDRIVASLVGQRTAWDVDALMEKRPCRITCWYAKECVFEKVPEVDAAIIAVPANTIGESPATEMFIVNEFGARVPAVLTSKLARHFAAEGVEMLPSTWVDREPGRRSCVVDRNLNRADENAMREYVATALGVKKLTFPFESQWIGVASLPITNSPA